MKRNLILAGCLVLLAGVLARAQNTSTTTPFIVTITCPDGMVSTLYWTFPASWVTVTPQDTITAGTGFEQPANVHDERKWKDSGAFLLQTCTDMNGHWITCPDQERTKPQSKPLPPMVAPTMRDVVTHHTELSCLKGYERWELVGNGREISPSEWEAPPEYLVCVTPAFIAELKKANGEQK